MYAPITWRTVNGPSLSEASRPLLAAQQSFNGSFDVLNNVLKQRQEAATYAQTKQEEAAKQGYLNDLSAIDNVDALAQQRQTFQERLKGLTPEQQAAVRGQFDQRVSALREQTRQAGEFADFSRDRAERGEVDAVQGLISAGDFTGAKQRLEALNLRNEAPLYKALTEGERGQTKFGWEQEEAQRKASMHPLDIAAREANIASSRQSTASAAEAQLASREARTRAEEDRAALRLATQAAALKENNIFGEGSLEPTRNIGEIAEFVKANVTDEGDAAKITRALAKAASNGFQLPDGQEVGYPMALVKAAILESEDTNNIWFSNRADNLTRILQDKMKNPRVVDDAMALYQMQANLRENPAALKPSRK